MAALPPGAPAGAIGYFDFFVRPRQQRWWLQNQQDVCFAVTSNSIYGSTVSAFVQNRHSPQSSLLTALGTIDRASWLEFLDYYQNVIGIPFQHQKYGGPRVGSNSQVVGGAHNVSPIIFDAHIINVHFGSALGNGGWESELTVRAFF